MGVPTTDDSSGYFRLLPHMWPLFVVPVICVYVVLAAWVARKLRGGTERKAQVGAFAKEPGQNPPT